MPTTILDYILKYEWDSKWEFVQGLLIVITGVLLTAIDKVSGWEQMGVEWWSGVSFAAAVAVLHYAHAMLTRSETTEPEDFI